MPPASYRQQAEFCPEIRVNDFWVKTDLVLSPRLRSLHCKTRPPAKTRGTKCLEYCLLRSFFSPSAASVLSTPRSTALDKSRPNSKSVGTKHHPVLTSPNGWIWTKLGARAIIKLSKISAALCTYDYRKLCQESEHDFWPPAVLPPGTRRRRERSHAESRRRELDREKGSKRIKDSRPLFRSLLSPFPLSSRNAAFDGLKAW